MNTSKLKACRYFFLNRVTKKEIHLLL